MKKLIATFRISKTDVIPRGLNGEKLSLRKSFNYVIGNYAMLLVFC
jgi:hypothetical protein